MFDLAVVVTNVALFTMAVAITFLTGPLWQFEAAKGDSLMVNRGPSLGLSLGGPILRLLIQ